MNSFKNWQASMWSAVRTAERESHYDLLNLYLKLEKKSKSLLASGEMNEGDLFCVPLETGQTMKVRFYKDYSTVDMQQPDGLVDNAISRQDSYRKEYRYLLATSRTLEASNYGIGAKASKEFYQVMSEAKVGDVFVFDRGQSYVCAGIFDKYKDFRKTCGISNKPNIKCIDEADHFSVDVTNELSIQEAFREVKDPYTNDIKMKITSLTDARGILNSLLADIETTKEINLGPNKIVAQKNRERKELFYVDSAGKHSVVAQQENGLVYFDSTGKQIPEEKVLLTLAWLEARPNEITVNRIGPEFPVDEFDTIISKRTIDSLMAKHAYREAVDYIHGLCLKNGSMELDMNSYVKNGESYEAVSYVFKRTEDNDVKISKVTYIDNDFDKNIKSIESISVKEIVTYCQQKYDENFVYIKNQILEECFEKFPDWQSDMYKELVDKLAKEKTDKMNIFDTKIDHVKDDVSALTRIDFDMGERDDV